MNPSPIRRCNSHEYFTGDSCPECGAHGEHLLTPSERKQLSKYLSGLLRHFPEDAGLQVDHHGWIDQEAVLSHLTSKYDWVTETMVEAIVTLDSNGRFQLEDQQIRAAYGHSIDVTLEHIDEPIPDLLYHGTSEDAVENIMEDGLRPMSRQLVHLSGELNGAKRVARRHTDNPIVLLIDAARMIPAGYRINRRGNGVYTTTYVPPEYIT